MRPIPDDSETATDTPINLHHLGRVRVLQALTEHPRLSRAQLVRRTGSARATVGSAGYAMGLDVGHDHVRAILTDVVGSLLWDRSVAIAVDDDPDRALDTAEHLITSAIGELDVPRKKIVGLGLGIACPVDKATGDLRAEGIMAGWAGRRPDRELTVRTGLPTQIINDANAGVLAERRFGAARDCANVIYVRLAAGIGAGMMSDGRLLLGHLGLAGELGHVTVERDGRVCRCGSRGCLETVASPAAIAGLLAASGGQPVDGIDLADLLRRHDRGAIRAVEDAGEAVGRALSAAVSLLKPELVVIGGDLAEAGEALLEPMRRTLRRGTMGSLHARPRIVPSALGDSAGVRGAAALVLDGVPERWGLDPASARADAG